MIEKFSGLFDPSKVTRPIHILGCGAIGSTLGVQLARCGLDNIYLWDYDKVEQVNLANQQFQYKHINLEKTEALKELMQAINPHIKIETRGEYLDEILSGYVFLAVDSIDVRKAVVQNHKYSNEVEVMFDFRMRLKDAQHYAADWSDKRQKDNLEKSMDFTQEEADAATPINACGLSQSIIPTVETVVSTGVANFINYIHDPEELKPFVMVNPFDYD